MSQPSVPTADIFRWDGTVSRQTYALVGIIGFAIKNNLDRYVARYFLPQSHEFFDYWAPLGKAARLNHLSKSEVNFLLVLMVLSMPFIWVGLVMTIRRLREAAAPLWLVCLFFIPFLNLIFFLVLCFLPPNEAPDRNDIAAPWPRVRTLDSVIPRGKLAVELLSVLLTAAIGLAFLYLGTEVLGSYGWSLFIALPFCMGMFSVLLYSYQPRNLAECLEVAVFPIFILGFVIVGIAVEGLICVLMAAPIALVLAALGGGIGAFIQHHYWGLHNKPALFSAILLVLPMAFISEHAAAPRPPELVVRSAVKINAPPEKVWNQVIAFSEIPPPTELLFRAGVAYPIRAEISGSGVGASRRCVFSTGAFLEPITVWDEPRLLKFDVEENPAPLNELSPYKKISAPHLHGYFISHGGQFLLTALPGGRTRLEGTTWYQHTMWPVTYWGWWSNYVIHRIHMRVLNHIRERAEIPAAQALAASALSNMR